MGTVTPLRKPVSVDRSPMPITRILSPEARLAFSSLKGRIGALDRCFMGAFVTESQASEIGKLCEEIRIEAQRVWRTSR